MTDPRSAGSNKARARNKTEQMRAERAAAAARQERNQRILMILGGVVAFGLVGAIVWALVTSAGGGSSPETKPRSPGNAAPANVEGAVIPLGQPDAPVTVDLYFDYMCGHCGDFERINGQTLDQAVEDGSILLNLHMMNFMDEATRNQYSTRAGNAVATAANESSELAWALHQALYANQPTGPDGLSDAEIADIAVDAGVPQEVADTFADGTYDNWVVKSNEAAGKDGVESTPTIKIDGELFEGNWGDPQVLIQTIAAAAE